MAATHTRTITLFCWVLDISDSSFPVDIEDSRTVGHLKDEILKKKPIAFANVDADQLKLWNASSIVTNGLRDLEDEVAKCNFLNDDVLLEQTRLSDVFPSPGPAQTTLHIVVRAPLVGAGSPTANHFQSAIRVRTGDPRRALSAKIHDLIRAIPNDLDFSDPKVLRKLPFPSLLAIPAERFDLTDDNDVVYFDYMGRVKFCDLVECIKRKNFLKARERLYVYGTSGSGKSHLLAALVCKLIRDRERVVYLPDCSRLLGDDGSVIKEALIFAFHDTDHLDVIENLHNVHDLIRFMSKQQNLYVVVDQMNALEVAGDVEKDSYSNRRIQASGWLDLMKRHRYIYSASANSESSREAHTTQSPIKVFSMFGGMTKDETDQWFIHNAYRLPPLSTNQKQTVEYLTGNVPLLLRSLVGITQFEAMKFIRSEEICKIRLDVESYFEAKLKELRDDIRLDSYLAIINACLRGVTFLLEDHKLYDWRYFYSDAEFFGHYTCGVVFQTITSAMREYGQATFNEVNWYLAVRQCKNPVVRGFLAEQICLTSIANDGLKAIDPTLGGMSTTVFSKIPDYSSLLTVDQDITRHLFVPRPYSLNAVDCVVILVDRSKQVAHIFKSCCQ